MSKEMLKSYRALRVKDALEMAMYYAERLSMLAFVAGFTLAVYGAATAAVWAFALGLASAAVWGGSGVISEICGRRIRSLGYTEAGLERLALA